MKKTNVVILIILLLVLCLSISACSQEESSIADHHELVWIVQPMLEYDYIFHCVYCDFFALGDHGGKLIDRETGKLMDKDNTAGGHGGWGIVSYDPKQNLIGIVDAKEVEMFPFDEFIEKHSYFFRRAYPVAVEQVNALIQEGYNEDGWYVVEHSGKYAVMYNGIFVTDFLFDAPCNLAARNVANGIIAMSRDGSWGIIDRNGDVALPFIFEHIIFIDDNTAFAKYKGRYGILDVRNTMVNLIEMES